MLLDVSGEIWENSVVHVFSVQALCKEAAAADGSKKALEEE